MSSGPEPLKNLHENIRRILGATPGQPLTSTMIVDLMNYIGKCVVSGNVRQTAEIAFGSYSDKAFLDLKNYEINPHRAEYGWTSNNSVICALGMNYDDICKRVNSNGEPGFFFLENAQKFGRMCDPPVRVHIVEFLLNTINSLILVAFLPLPFFLFLISELQGREGARWKSLPGANPGVL